uniref:Small integral membrane protein 12-like n=1 Tax=Saccoglossus kowalevskii TaxID=10224 RepID=A0ABM0LW21_SACKO|nr:PREDICTED: small integral membrane protein 12-like [Saccoglossus kowalevskii]
MWPLILASVRTYAPYVTFPFAVVVGIVGYNIEKFVRKNKQSPQVHRVLEERNDRQLDQQLGQEDATQVASLKDYKPKPEFKFEKTLRAERE